MNIEDIINENNRRRQAINAKFNPITGEGSILQRKPLSLPDFPLPTQFLPVAMFKVPLVKRLLEAKSLDAFIRSILDDKAKGTASMEREREKVLRQFIRLRCRFDFAFWAATFVFIKQKGGGEDIRFRLNRPQRTLISTLEQMRLKNQPIRLILLKARQWGGSTATQLYMAWLQLVHKVGLNSLIVGHVKDSSIEVKDMFDRMIQHYPVEMLHRLGDEYKPNEDKLVGVGRSGNIHRIPQRNCKIKIGTAEMPNSARGGDYNLVHLTEVGLWKTTEKMTPEGIVRSACAGMLLKPYTMIVYESTANGTGNFFHREYLAAKSGTSQFKPLFIAWKDIEQYQLQFEDDEHRKRFAQWLIDNRDNDITTSDRQETGRYLWRQWERGATLEALNWYNAERSKYNNHADMAAEYPSDDVEAFAFSGRKVFNDEDVEMFRPACRPPRWTGEIYGRDDIGAEALENLQFRQVRNGRLAIWEDVERDDDEMVTDQYLVVVDVCKGTSEKADYAVIAVFNRILMLDSQPPAVVAQWYGHIDMDMLAWKAVQVAEYYNHALLVIESNTLETNNTKGEAEYILNVIRDVYDNLYARKQSPEDIKEGKPRKYGFHTNSLTKKVIIHHLKTMIREHLYVERDSGCLDEFLTYIETERGGFEASEGHHDDRLMTRAIGLKICYTEMDLPRITPRNKPTTHHRKAISEASL